MNDLTFDSSPFRVFSNYGSVNSILNECLDPSLVPNSSDGENSPYTNEKFTFSYAAFKYLNDLLMEEDLDGKSCMLQDSLALQAAEKSFYDVLVQNNSPSSNQICPCPNHQNYTTCSPTKSSRNDFFAPNTLQGDDFEGGISLEEGRKKKHQVLLLEESEESSMFDEVMLPKEGNFDDSMNCPLFDEARHRAREKLDHDGKIKKFESRRARLLGRNVMNKLVDLRDMLVQCAEAVASYDRKSAQELLVEIHKHSTPFGDATQRLGHYFSRSLEARLNGTGKPLCSPGFVERTSAADILKGYLSYFSACPFRRMSNIFTNRTIGKLVKKVPSIHIIDFGISYGFQWPCFIQHHSFRPGGPPMVRITGIELPQPGFRPSERVEETGRRLERVCQRCNVPFKYIAIAKRWETIQIEDLNIDSNELTIVTCMYRLDNLPNDTVVSKSSRDAVLGLIKRINPDLFVHGVINGTYNSPFFVPRFKESLFHFYALFDMFATTLPCEDEGRMIFEREVLGKRIMNVIACEGLERTDSPESYKQWQARMKRAGFKQQPLDQDLMKKVEKLVETQYHKDFVINDHSHWMMQGWKGRVINALSFWKPVTC